MKIILNLLRRNYPNSYQNNKSERVKLTQMSRLKGKNLIFLIFVDVKSLAKGKSLCFLDFALIFPWAAHHIVSRIPIYELRIFAVFFNQSDVIDKNNNKQTTFVNIQNYEFVKTCGEQLNFSLGNGMFEWQSLIPTQNI